MKSKFRAAICIIFPILGLSSFAQGELLTNRDFSSGDFSGWNTTADGWSIGEGVNREAETNGVVFQCDGSNSGDILYLYQEVPVVGTESYSASVFIQVTNIASSECWLEIEWLKSNGSTIRRTRTFSVSSNQTYTPLRIISTIAPLQAVTARVQVVVNLQESSPFDFDSYSFDSFSFVQLLPGLLTNRGFEFGNMNGWNTVGGKWGTAFAFTTIGIYATSYYKFPGDTNELAMIYQCVPVTPGSMYAAFAGIYSEFSGNASAWLEVQWLDNRDEIISVNASEPVLPNYPYQFQFPKLFSLTAPPGAVTACVRAVIDTSGFEPDETPQFSFDEFYFIPVVPLSIDDDTSNHQVLSWDGSGFPGFLQSSTNLLEEQWNYTNLVPDLVSNRWVVPIDSSLSNAVFRLYFPY